MGKELVIVESPAKARTITAMLGNKYEIKPSLGHVRDLPKSRLGVDVDKDFAAKYIVPKEKKKIVQEIKAAAKGSSAIYLATDPDREGEAISWHLVQAVGLNGGTVKRVVFHEITKEAVEEAFAHPRDIDLRLVNAQQARRILDRLVGYSLSPLLWKKVRGRLSAGRVQSVALRMVVEREREVMGFVPKEYWSIEAELRPGGPVRQEASEAKGRGALSRPKGRKGESFRATLVGLADNGNGLKAKPVEIEIKNQEDANGLVKILREAAYRVAQVRKGQSTRQPAPPFTTSTLQQEAARKLRFTPQHTMAVAQQLYEGLSLGDQGTVGLITYMRTDSVRVAGSAQKEARDFIAAKYGRAYLPKAPRAFKTRTKGAQEAHEAIRPTSIWREPQQMRPYLNDRQFRLYELIWLRMVASQMASAISDTLTVDIVAEVPPISHPYLFRASQTQVRFPGFQILYSEGTDDENGKRASDQGIAVRKKAHPAEEGSSFRGRTAKPTPLAALSMGDALELIDLFPEQHFTKPPARYTDATLIKSLEANGIGRPSTYAMILTTLQERGYVGKEGRSLYPRELGFIVCDLLTENFPDVMDIGFTAKLEEELDDIAEGEREMVPVLRNFYGPFSVDLKEAEERMAHVELAPELTGELCEKCGKPMLVRYSRYGKFAGCGGFPECRNAKPILPKIGVPCPKCGSPLVERRVRARGAARSAPKGRRRLFYGCSRYPECDFTSWDRPLAKPCPECGGLLVSRGANAAHCSQCGRTLSLRESERLPTDETYEKDPALVGNALLPGEESE